MQHLAPCRVAIRFFSTTAFVGLCSLLMAWSLASLFQRVETDTFRFPIAFAVSTLLLFAGSLLVHQALQAVRREQQARFRRAMLLTLAAGTIFMGVQSFALWQIVPAERSASFASLGVAPFVLVLAAIHGMHFLVSILFLSYVTTQALVGRYDHEYHWGVTVCAGFWHALGVAWLAILAVYSIVLIS